jgi:hypothetical protein
MSQAKKKTPVGKYALCIGINDYPGTGSDLSGCVNDANDWAKVFTQRGFTVQKLLNKHATGAAIRDAIRETVDGAKSGDLVVIQYSGHGSYVPDMNGDEPDGTDECLCPYDIKRKGPITDDELFDLFIRRERGVKVVMVSDSCHSGSVARFAMASARSNGHGNGHRVRFLAPAAFLSKRKLAQLGARRAVRASSPPGRYGGLLVAGCQDKEFSYDAEFRGRANGAFTHMALQALRNLPGSATYRAWFGSIRKTLPSQEYPQTPNLYGSNSMKRWKVLA